MHAFIVEGHMERAIVQKLCMGAPVRRLGVNGDDVSIRVIAKFAHAQLLTLRDRYHPVYIIFDREKRSQSVEELREELARHLELMGHSRELFRICIADREFESWIAPFMDDEGIVQATALRSMEGQNGKAVIKEKMKFVGRIYSETVHGVQFFCSINPRRISEISDSFRYLFDNIGGGCSWKKHSE